MSLIVNPYRNTQLQRRDLPMSLKPLRSKVTKMTQFQTILWPFSEVCLPKKSPIVLKTAYELMDDAYFCPAVGSGVDYSIAPVTELDVIASPIHTYQICFTYTICEVTADSVLLAEDGRITVEEALTGGVPVAFARNLSKDYVEPTGVSLLYKPIIAIRHDSSNPVISISMWDAYDKLDEDFALIAGEGLLIL